MSSLGKDQLRQRFGKAVTLHQGDPSPYVTVHAPIALLGSEPLCTGLNEILKQGGRQWERRIATANLWEQLPSSAGLYMFLWMPELEFVVADGTGPVPWRFPWILYVGEAGAGESRNTLHERYKGEYSGILDGDPEQLWTSRLGRRPSRAELLKHYLTLFPLEYWYLEIDDHAQVAPLERRLLQMLNPPLVFQNRAQLVGKPEPAF